MPINYYSTQSFIGDSSPKITGPFPQNTTSNCILNSPIGIIRDPNKNFWITDTGNNRIIVFNKDFSKIQWCINDLGALGSLDMPFRLCHHPKKEWIYVTEMGKDRVIIFEYKLKNKNITDMNVVETFGSKGYGEGQFNGPNGIETLTLNNKVQIFVCDEFSSNDKKGRILIFNEDGTISSDFKTINYLVDTSKNKNYFLWPQGLSSNDNTLYLCDVGNYRILKFSPKKNSTEQEAINFCKPSLKGGFYPTFSANRKAKVINDKIYVVDTGANKIFVFNMFGEYICTIGTVNFIKRLNPNKFNGLIAPNDITEVNIQAIDNNEYIAVVESGFPCVSVFEVTIPQTTSMIENNVLANQISTIDNTKTNDRQFSYTVSVSNYKSNTTMVVDNRFADLKSGLFDNQIKNWQKVSDIFQYINKDSNIWFLIGCIDIMINPVNDILFASSPYTNTIHYAKLSSIFPDINTHFFSGQGTGDDKLNNPRGIFVIEDLIYIADTNNSRISIWQFDVNNYTVKWERNFSCYNSNAKTFYFPTGIAINPANNDVYIVDTYYHKIIIFNNQGSFKKEFGGFGYLKNQFFYPVGLKIFDNKVFILDMGNRAIKVWDIEGNNVIDSDLYPIVESNYYTQALGSSQGSMWWPFPFDIDENYLKDFLILPDGLLNRINIYKYTK